MVDDATFGLATDLDANRAALFASDTGATTVSTAEAVIEDSDAVYVCTWTAAHRELVEQVAAAGKAVFCEKPLATNLASARAMTNAVAGVTNQVGLVLRHSPSFRWLQDACQNRAENGRIMNVVFRDDQYIPIQGMYGSTWRGDPALAGAGTLLEHSIHDIDLLEWMLGPLVEVAAFSNEVHGIEGIEDSVTVMLRTESGAQAALISVWHDVLSRPSQRRVEVICERATLTLEGDWVGPVRWERSTDDHGVLTDLATSLSPDADFIRAVRLGQPASPDFSVALQAHAVADAIYRSAATGGAVTTVERF